MKKLIGLPVIVVLVLMVLSQSALSQSASYYQQKLYSIDSQIQRIMGLRKQNTNTQREVEAWSNEAGAWMAEHDQVNAAIWAANQRKGDYGTMNQRQLNESIKSLEAELAQLTKPPGGRMVGGKRYYNLVDVYDDMGWVGKELDRLQIDRHKMTQDLFRWDAERDKVASEWRRKANKKIPNNTELIKTLKAERNLKIRQINDNELWCYRDYTISKEGLGYTPVVCRERRSVMIGLAIQHKADAIRQGIEPEREVLAEMVKQAQKSSRITKKDMQENDLKALTQAIKSLVARDLHTAILTPAPPAAPPEVELIGCWKIFDPMGGKPATVNIAKDRGEYTARITDYAWINHPNGHVLFRLARINGTTFEGTEYSKYNNKVTRTHLRVIVANDGRGATYRTRDDTLRLVSCY